mmetsp:Transcript_835/g.2589  ORF Transcript_835/g.2589 Transcript_835/m.2589 type:complete len:221 (+) Transcript_835:415-1077(+)
MRRAMRRRHCSAAAGRSSRDAPRSGGPARWDGVCCRRQGRRARAAWRGNGSGAHTRRSGGGSSCRCCGARTDPRWLAYTHRSHPGCSRRSHPDWIDWGCPAVADPWRPAAHSHPCHGRGPGPRWSGHTGGRRCVARSRGPTAARTPGRTAGCSPAPTAGCSRGPRPGCLARRGAGTGPGRAAARTLQLAPPAGGRRGCGCGLGEAEGCLGRRSATRLCHG